MASSNPSSEPVTPGILYVTMSPHASLPTAQFQNWYNNEHGPNRLSMPSVFEDGYRYRASDLAGKGTSDAKPEWMAIYDVKDMYDLTRKTYLKLRDPKIQSQRERDTMKQITVDRKFFDFVSERKKEGYAPLDSVPADKADGTVLVAVGMTLVDGPGSEAEKDFDGWYNEEHISMLAAVPGWRRTRRFKTSVIEPATGEQKVTYLALHEYTAKNGLGGPEHLAAQDTPWRDRIMAKRVAAKWRREYDLYYVFGAGARDLQALSQEGSGAEEWQNTENTFRTWSVPSPFAPAIEGQVVTPDGVVLPYRLEGSPEPDAPLLIFVNSILTTYNMWDPFLTLFRQNPKNRNYRILRFNQRGRSPLPGSSTSPVIMDVLANDVLTMLNALRVPKAAAVIGVSQGGATTALFAIKHPDRLERYISCDHQPVSTSGAVWDERIVVAEADTSSAPTTQWHTSTSPDRGVGETLAEMTVRRWFAPTAYDGGVVEAEVLKVKEMVKSNSLDGFKKGVNALYVYDLRDGMKKCKVPGGFVVGGKDGGGVLAQKMTEWGAENSRKCIVIDGAGHLPMVEKPKEFGEVVEGFLRG